jgi:hypothetical protein
LHNRVRALRDAYDSPRVITGSQHGLLRENGGVRAGKGTQAEVHDSGLNTLAWQLWFYSLSRGEGCPA